MNESLRPSVPEHRSEFDFSHEIFLMTDTMHRHPWAVGLLRDFGSVMPYDLESSWRAAQITASVVTKLREQDENVFVTYDDIDTMVLGAALQDIGRGVEEPDIRREVYTEGIRWRDDPNAWQWDVVRRHPMQSHNLVLEVTDDPDTGVGYHVAQIVYLHHALKRKGPYPDIEEGTFDRLDPIVRQGIDIVAAVDVAEAVSKNYKGHGRRYLKDEEFAGLSLGEVVQGEIAVDERIANLAAEQTLRFKAINL